MSAPGGSVTWTLKFWVLPLTFFIVRSVSICPGMTGALMLGRFRSMRPSGSAADARYWPALTSNVTVGLIAVLARMEPAPRSNGSDGVTPSSLTTLWTEEVMSADLIWPGVHLG